MTTLSVTRNPDFRTPYAHHQDWTAGFDVAGPRIRGSVWVTPCRLDTRDDYLPSGIAVHYGPSAASIPTHDVGLTVNGVRLTGSVKIERPDPTRPVPCHIIAIDGRGEMVSAAAGVQQVMPDILQRVIATYLADQDTVTTSRLAYRHAAAARLLRHAARDVSALERQAADLAKRIEKKRSEEARLRAIVG